MAGKIAEAHGLSKSRICEIQIEGVAAISTGKIDCETRVRAEPIILVQHYIAGKGVCGRKTSNPQRKYSQ